MPPKRVPRFGGTTRTSGQRNRGTIVLNVPATVHPNVQPSDQLSAPASAQPSVLPRRSVRAPSVRVSIRAPSSRVSVRAPSGRVSRPNVRLMDLNGQPMNRPIQPAANPNPAPTNDPAPISVVVPRRRCRRVKEAGMNYNPNENYDWAHIGKCDVVCPKCYALKFKGETTGLCCAKGEVKLPPLQPLPPEIQYYVDHPETRESKEFFRNMRQYNSLFQMTSFRSKKSTGGPDPHRHPGNYGFSTTFSMQGQIYHNIKSLRNTDGVEPAFLQLYFTGFNEGDKRSVLFIAI